ncbi:ketopantoate reductase family protein [Piscinibacter gummiphilus]|nr:2-dehydropantoate 2-reductase [Piscinibacter gummiphilus]ATU63718.1 2-dehydropantoate 2-reductase [Piscinibacter gummiphilus]GLS93348.1 2-dehydropantoate 2-reductase [Piscinibacter gummiphilus]
MPETSPLTHPRIAVMGAGAVGCFYGGMLARAGHDVVLIARPGHVDAIRRDGLRLQAQTFDESIRLSAETGPEAVRGAKVVLFCVKSPDTEAAGAAIAPFLDADAVVLTLQNGVDNADRLRHVVPREVAATVVYVATGMAGPGHVRHHGRGELVIEPTSRGDALVRLFADAGIPTEVSDNVRGALWVKLIINCAYNALSALTQMPYGWLVQQPGVTGVLDDVVAECKAVAAAEGISLPGDVDLAVRRIAETMATQVSSTAGDLARGKPSEIDHLNGLVVRRGEALGVPVPANRLLRTLVKALEAKVRPPH